VHGLRDTLAGQILKSAAEALSRRHEATSAAASAPRASCIANIRWLLVAAKADRDGKVRWIGDRSEHFTDRRAWPRQRHDRARWRSTRRGASWR
jgi:hypothetical protein